MRRSSQKSGNSLKIALIFFCLIFLLIVGGILLKLFLILQLSTYDGSHQYILEVDESNQKGELIAFLPQTKSVTILTISGSVDHGFGQYIDVPVDATVHLPISSNINQLIQEMLIHGANGQGMTVIDKLRLLLFVNMVKPVDMHQQSIQLPIDATVSQKLLPSLFLDQTLYADNESVAVVNATGVQGLGSRVAKRLTVLGINVVSVTSVDPLGNGTVLTARNTNTYTVSRISKIFHAKTQMSKGPSISDITLTVGKDSLLLLQ